MTSFLACSVDAGSRIYRGSAFRLLNEYKLSAGPPSTVIVPNASRLSKIQEVTIRGTVLRRQIAHWDPRALRHRISPGRSRGRYVLHSDGSLEICVGVRALQPHVTCVLSDGFAVLSRLNAAGAAVTISGFLRCSFAGSGLEATDNARIFELNPIRSVEIDGEVRSFDLNCPGPPVPDWTPALNELDEKRTVQYWKGSDTLVFSNIGSEGAGHFRATGEVQDIKLNIGTNRPAWFVLNSGNAASRQMRVACLQGTRPDDSVLRRLKSSRVVVIGAKAQNFRNAGHWKYSWSNFHYS